MKKCPKCHELYSDDVEKCTDCDILLEPYQEQKTSKFAEIFEEYKKGIISCALIAAFLLGFGFKSCTGIKTVDYAALQNEKNKLNEEYLAYKDKMQPYEAQQQADVKVAEEKKIAEEQAKKEAEAQEAKERAIRMQEQKRNSYDALQKLYLDVNQDMDYDTALNMAKATGLICEERGNVSSKRIRVAYTEDGAKELHCKGDFTEITFDSEVINTERKWHMSCIHYSNYEKGMSAINLISGSYWSINDPGLYINDMGTYSTAYSGESQIDKIRQK